MENKKLSQLVREQMPMIKRGINAFALAGLLVVAGCGKNPIAPEPNTGDGQQGEPILIVTPQTPNDPTLPGNNNGGCQDCKGDDPIGFIEPDKDDLLNDKNQFNTGSGGGDGGKGNDDDPIGYTGDGNCPQGQSLQKDIEGFLKCLPIEDDPIGFIFERDV